MRVTVATLGEQADLYLVDLAPHIARARHRVLFGDLCQTAPQFAIPVTAKTWPYERPLQNIDATIATLQQWWVRRKQRQALNAATLHSGSTVEKAEAACRAYYKAVADLEIRRERMQARVARHMPKLQAA